MHIHYQIFCLLPRLKPPLDAAQERDRVRLAKEGIEIPEHAIVFSDEMLVVFNSTRRMRNWSRKRGSSPYLQAEPKDRDDGTI